MSKKSIYSKKSALLGEWLRTQREACELSLREFEEISGWSRSIIGKIETGHRRVDVVEFLQLCELLEVNPHDGIKYISK